MNLSLKITITVSLITLTIVFIALIKSLIKKKKLINNDIDFPEGVILYQNGKEVNSDTVNKQLKDGRKTSVLNEIMNMIWELILLLSNKN